MTTHTPLAEAQRVIGQHWRQGQPPEQERLLRCASDALLFIFSSGQRYPFEDYRGHRTADGKAPPTGATTPLDALARSAREFFVQRLSESASPEERELVQVIIDALEFIVSADLVEAFGDFRTHLESNDPPRVVAAFETREEAETWLREHPSPPDAAHLLVGDRYYTVMYARGTNLRRLCTERTLEHYLAGLKQDEPPIAEASFKTREEAEAWLRARPASARRAWVLIAGEFHLAVHHPHINRRALYPLSLADGVAVHTEPPHR